MSSWRPSAGTGTEPGRRAHHRLAQAAERLVEGVDELVGQVAARAVGSGRGGRRQRLRTACGRHRRSATTALTIVAHLRGRYAVRIACVAHITLRVPPDCVCSTCIDAASLRLGMRRPRRAYVRVRDGSHGWSVPLGRAQAVVRRCGAFVADGRGHRFILGTAFGGTLNDSFSLPDTESLQAQELLEQLPDGQASGGHHAPPPTIVWSPDAEGATAVDAATAAMISPLLTDDLEAPRRRVRDQPVQQDRRRALGVDCPTPQGRALTSRTVPAEQQEAVKAALLATQQALSPISADGHVAKSVVTFDGGGDGADVPTETAKAIIDRGQGRQRRQTACRSAPTARCSRSPARSRRAARRIGMLVALVILLIAFGSLARRRPPAAHRRSSASPRRPAAALRRPLRATSPPSPPPWRR